MGLDKGDWDMTVYTEETFLEKLKEKNRDWDKIEFLSPFVKAKQKIQCRCKVCGYEWSPIPSSLLQDSGCRVCRMEEQIKNQTKTHEQFMQEFNDIKANNPHLEYVELLDKYENEKTKIKAKCHYCNKEWNATPRNLLKGNGCPNCKGRFVSQYRKANNVWGGENNPRHISPMCGKDNPNWKDGITSLYSELRSETKDWFMATNKFFDWKCALTGVKFDNVHHLVEFKDILAEVLEIYELDRRKSIGDYSEKEQKWIKDGIRQLHKKYGYGVSLCETIHMLFHKIYSYDNCDKYDFLEFTNRCVSGEFNDYLAQHGLSININPKIYNVLLNNLY